MITALRAVAVLEHGKFHGLGAVDEQATAKAFLIPNDPVASAVPADQEQRGTRTMRRGRFVHDMSPLFGQCATSPTCGPRDP
jgi:hypothetical protein